MSQSEHLGTAIEFGPWRFLPERNLLQGPGGQRELEHRLSVLLLHLCSNPGPVLGKDALLQAVWGQRVVNEDSLSVAVSQLRKALDDQPRAPRYIRTVPGVGYQWIAPVARAAAHQPRRHRALLLIGLLLIAGLAVSFGAWQWLASPPGAGRSADAPADAAQLAYRHARGLLASDAPQHWRDAVSGFRAAIAADPAHADAHVGLVEAKLAQLHHGKLPLAPHHAELRDLLARALELEPEHAQALLLRARLLFLHGWDHAAAEQTWQRLLQAHPDHLAGRQSYAHFLLAQGRFAEAATELEELRRRQPLLYAVPAVAWNYLMQGENERAWDEIQRITSTEPQSAAYHASAQHIAFQRGDAERAMQHLLELMQLEALGADRIAGFRDDFSRGGLAAVHQRLLDEREDAALGHYRPPLAWARYALVAGHHERALAHLESALAARQVELLWLAVDPHYQPLHGHRRFEALLRTLGLRVPVSR